MFAFSPESVARPSEATGGGAEQGSSRESSERRAFPCATGAARGGECARATRRRRREARADECVAFRENRRCLGTDEKGSGEKTPEAARNERPEPDRARRRAGILTSPSLASRGNVTVYDSGNERSLSGRTDALEPGTTSQQRASPSRVDRTRAPRPRLARAFFAISSLVPSTLLRVTPSQRSRARARVTLARPTCRARPPSSAARWGSPCRCTSTPCASSRSCAVRPPPPPRPPPVTDPPRPARPTPGGVFDARGRSARLGFAPPPALVVPRRVRPRATRSFARRPTRDARRGAPPTSRAAPPR